MATDNGLRKFTHHEKDHLGPGAIEPILGVSGADESAPLPASFSSLSPEEAARRYLSSALGRSDLAELSAEPLGNESPEFDLISVESIPLTKTRAVKFRQRFHKIPVYGSLVTIELGRHNDLISIWSTLGQPEVSPVARVSPASALATVRQAAHLSEDEGEWAPQLHFYYYSQEGGWRLVYIFEDVAIRGGGAPGEYAQFVDFVIDAHSGEVLTELPRVHGQREFATDGYGNRRPIQVVPASQQGRRKLVNLRDGVHTFDFNFRSYIDHFTSLPGDPVETGTTAWPRDAVSAHYNASAVAGFLRRTLLRDGIDDRGAPYVSTIRCTRTSPGREWRNAAWIPGRQQMIYGQRLQPNGALRSYSVALDIVAHEFFHGVTSSSARIMYSAESGALNESLSDIFGVIVSNYRGSRRRRLDLWNWEMGEDLDQTGGVAIRDIRHPELFGQPNHMDDYRNLPESEDHGGVHTNSGIHNRAGYLMLTSRRSPEHPTTLTPTEVAALYYLSVTQFLSRTSTFSDSRQGVILAAKSLFRNRADRDELIQVIESSFSGVGIE